MADIVIHGMDVPKLCCECPLKESMYDVGYICLPRKEPIKVNLHKGIDDACPLLPLPEGHGRMGDLDALDKFLAEREKEAEAEEFYLGEYWYNTFRQILKKRPTIVPAEGGGEDG